MAVDLSPIDENLLAEIANIHGLPKGAFNIRKDGQLVERHSSANIEIATKTDNPGIDIHIAPGTKGETVFIPVIVTQSGLKDVVYNTFYVGDDIEEDDIRAKFEDGVLKIAVPKKQEQPKLEEKKTLAIEG